jgi:ketosteroid isomerase-like protein
MRYFAIVAGWLLLGATPALAQDKAAIEKLNDAWMAAFNKGDAAAVAAMYTEDAYVLPPGAEMVKGHAAIEAFWRQAAQQMGEAKLTTVDVLPLEHDPKSLNQKVIFTHWVL